MRSEGETIVNTISSDVSKHLASHAVATTRETTKYGSFI